MEIKKFIEEHKKAILIGGGIVLSAASVILLKKWMSPTIMPATFAESSGYSDLPLPDTDIGEVVWNKDCGGYLDMAINNVQMIKWDELGNVIKDTWNLDDNAYVHIDIATSKNV